MTKMVKFHVDSGCKLFFMRIVAIMENKIFLRIHRIKEVSFLRIIVNFHIVVFCAIKMHVNTNIYYNLCTSHL